METKDILKKIRTDHQITQDEMAEKLAVTRQAVSRWEQGESIPNIDTLKQISTIFDVSINTLLGSPRKLVCQCCGMPMEDDTVISREKIIALMKTIVNGVMQMVSLSTKV